jgi:hypothetical protein
MWLEEVGTVVIVTGTKSGGLHVGCGVRVEREYTWYARPKGKHVTKGIMSYRV